MAFDSSIITAYWPLIVRGAALTVAISGLAILLGLCLGLIVALLKVLGSGWLNPLSTVFIEAIRNVPFLIIAFLVFYGLPRYGIRLEATLAGVVSLSLYSSAYFAEIIRGAILAVPKGQLQSARAMGMSHLLAMRRIIFPQMLGYLIPPLTNQLIITVKQSSVLSIITVTEMTMSAEKVISMTYSPVEVYALITLLYWLLSIGIELVMRCMEHRITLYRQVETVKSDPARVFWSAER